MSMVLIVDIDKENQNVHIGEENGSGCLYHMETADDVAIAVKDFLEGYMEFEVKANG